MERVREIEKQLKETEIPVDEDAVAKLSLSSFCKPSPYTLEELRMQYLTLKQKKM